MAVIGCLGDLLFTVSEETTLALSSLEWSGSARYGVHDRHLTHALTEFTGLEPDKITFELTLSAQLGVDPMTELTKLWKLERSGQAVPLTIGTHCYGKYRWTITGHQTKALAHYRNGDLHTATLSVSLQEYLEA